MRSEGFVLLFAGSPHLDFFDVQPFRGRADVCRLRARSIWF
jgi:hypothetical protein